MDNVTKQATPDMSSFSAIKLVDIDSIFKRASKHPRYISDWADSSITINIAEDRETVERIRIYDLNEVWLPANYPHGPFTKSVNLAEFSHWESLVKLMVNEALHTNKTMVGDRVGQTIVSCHRLFAWCVHRGVYQLSALTKDDFRELLIGVSGGWYKALNMETALFSLTLRASGDKELLNRLVNTIDSKPALRANEISKEIGLPIGNSRLPSYLFNDLFKRANCMPTSGRSYGRNDFDEPPSLGSLISDLYIINLMHSLPNGLDKPSYLPYPNMNVLAKKHVKGTSEGRTKNLSMEDAVKLLDLSIKYIYEYAPGIIKLGNEIRNWVSSTDKKTVSKISSMFINQKFRELQKEYSFPVDTISGLNQRTRGNNKRDNTPEESNLCFIDLIQSLQTACMMMAGMNHGRRKNELLGEGHRPYGLYLGCVSEVVSGIKHNKLDIYIEKTVRNYVDFWCNKLVVDSVSTLEDVYNLFRSLNSEPLKGEFGTSKSRREKLFRFKSFTKDSLNSEQWSSYNYYNHSTSFLHQSGIEPGVIDHKTHVFRRFFSLIYYYRYDNPTLLALSKHLQHLGLSMTRTYVTDPSFRNHADSIAVLYNNEIDDFIMEKDVVGKEYLKDKIKEIIHGRPTGGGMSNVVYDIYTHLLKRVEFRVSDEDAQVVEISNNLITKGYSPEPRTMGVCMLTDSCKQDDAKCYSDGIAHTESAKLKTCMECPYDFDNENYINALRVEADEINEKSNDFTITLAEQLAYQNTARELEELIELEEAIQIKNAEKIMQLKATAYLYWSQNDKIKVSIKSEEKASIIKSETARA